MELAQREKELEDKKIKVKIPSGTQNGKVLRLRSEGVPVLNNPNRRGDLYIKIIVNIKLFVFPSSTSIYGISCEEVFEDDDKYLNPQSS